MSNYPNSTVYIIFKTNHYLDKFNLGFNFIEELCSLNLFEELELAVSKEVAGRVAEVAGPVTEVVGRAVEGVLLDCCNFVAVHLYEDFPLFTDGLTGWDLLGFLF